MNHFDKTQSHIKATINGLTVNAPSTFSVIQALWHSGIPQLKSIGCLEGVCGSCRIYLQKSESQKITMALACETQIEEGMVVVFPPFSDSSNHQYQLSDILNSNQTQSAFQRFFPEADHCRCCGGCTQSCPKNLDVERGVSLANQGDFKAAGDIFSHCVMCDFCTSACPDNIAPNLVGLFARRVSAVFQTKPPNLMRRLTELAQGKASVIEPSDKVEVK